MTFKEKILFSVATFKGWQRYAATLIFLLLVISCWWFFSYRTVYTALRQAQQYTVVQQAVEQITAVDKEAAIPDESLALYPGVADELSALTLAQTYEKRRAAFFVQKFLNSWEDELSAVGKKCELNVCNYHLEGLPAHKDWYSYARVKATSSGSLQQPDDIKRLLHFFESFELFDNVHIERCQLTMLPSSVIKLECLFGIYLPV